MRFREDILRGVRLFAIVFAAILICVAGYRMLRASSDVQGAAPDVAAPPSPEPSSVETPVSETAPEVHPLVVPEPPHVGGTPVVSHAAHPRNQDVPPPPPPLVPVVRARRAPAPSGKEFEASTTIPLPGAPVESSPEVKPLAPKQAVGYKSLLEADPNRVPAEAVAPPASDDESEDKPAKGNRFFKAIGKIFHPNGKKETTPLSLQPKP